MVGCQIVSVLGGWIGNLQDLVQLDFVLFSNPNLFPMASITIGVGKTDLKNSFP